MLRGLVGFMVLTFSTMLWIGWASEEDGFTGWKGFLLAAGLTAAGIYILSSRKVGAAFQKVEKWQAIQQAKNAELNEAVTRGGLKGMLFGVPPSPTPEPSPRSEPHLTAAQIRAISNPETAQALQNLQNLLYTRAISDEEFQAAKSNLLRSGRANAQNDALAHLERLVELHEAGILDDVEFTAAKLKVLGLT